MGSSFLELARRCLLSGTYFQVKYHMFKRSFYGENGASTIGVVPSRTCGDVQLCGSPPKRDSRLKCDLVSSMQSGSSPKKYIPTQTHQTRERQQMLLPSSTRFISMQKNEKSSVQDARCVYKHKHERRDASYVQQMKQYIEPSEQTAPPPISIRVEM